MRVNLSGTYAEAESAGRRQSRMPVLALVLVLLVALDVVLFAARATPMLELRHPDGSISLVRSLDKPALSDTRVLGWVSDVVTGAYTFNVENYDARLNETSKFFVPEAFAGFRQGLEDSGIGQKMRDRLAIVTSVTSAPAVMLKQARFSGSRLWKVQVPVLVTFRSGRFVPETVSYVVTVILVERSPDVEPSGLAITAFFANSDTKE